MTVTAFAGPLITFGGNSNPENAPSLFNRMDGMLDPRTPYTYQRGGISPVYGFLGTGRMAAIQAVPATLAANNIGASAVPVSGTAFTLVSATGAGITAGVSITRADTGVTVSNLLAIDGAAGTVNFGADTSQTRMWNPATLLARTVRIVSVGNDSGGTFTVRGYDIYGYPMTETITGANAGTANGVKAFKYIVSVTPGGTMSGSAITIGTTDVIGLPFRADYVNETEISMADAWITAVTGFTAAVTTSPATATTGDVRGTYALQTASNGTRRLAVFQSPLLTNIDSVAGLFGVTQYADF